MSLFYNLKSILIVLSKFLIVLVPILISVAIVTVIERKVMGSIQRRKGPNWVGIYGLLQPFADALKLFVKESVFPNRANLVLFILAPMLTFMLSLMSWVIIPFGSDAVVSDLNLGILYIFAISSLGVYGIIIAGWASNSKYAFLGGLRSAAQMVSYEVSIGLIMLCVILCSNSLNLSAIMEAQKYIWYIIPLFPIFVLFFISALAETNRAPFDLPEAEAELVAGYNVEYASMGFALFFIGEYANIIMMSVLCVILFLGGWNTFPLLGFLGNSFSFSLKLSFIVFLFVWVRAAYPRYRYDQLMQLGWKVFLPLSLGYLSMIAGIVKGFDLFPYITFYGH